MAGTFHEWLSQGEALYQAALKDYRAIETQLDDLESKLVAKQAEVNQIAQVIGKPPVESNRCLAPTGGQMVAAAGNIDIIDVPPERTGPAAGSNASIARALTGKFGR